MDIFPLLPLLLVLGSVLRRTGLCTEQDGESAARLANMVTLPSLILQAFHRTALRDLPVLALPLSMAALALSAATGWALWRRRHPKERGLLAGSALGSAQALAALPLVQALVGVSGLRTALLAGAVNLVAVWAASFGLFATAGAAFPEAQAHLDGGSYRGEWKGMLKEGYGVYSYPSGARYEGEWRNGQKEGRGVFRFAKEGGKGGVYEGEWRGGVQAGVGVRTLASGAVRAGVWEAGKRVAELEEWQCTLAVEGAAEAAAAARRVEVGPGTVREAALRLAAQPATWAYVLAAALVVLGRPLTPTLDLVTSQLAGAHAPLALLALGLTLNLSLPPRRQLPEVSASLAVRLVPPLLLAAGACAGLGALGWPVQSVVGLAAPLVLCWASPVSPQTLQYAHRFRLNESLAASITSAGSAASLALAAMAAAAAVLSAATDSLLPFCATLAAAAAALVAAAAAAALAGPGQPAGQQQQQQRRQQQQERAGPGKVRMVYAGPLPAVAAVPPAAAATPQAADAAAAPEAAGEAEAAAPEAAGEEQATSVEPPRDAPKRRSAFTDLDDGGSAPQPPSAAAAAAPPPRSRRRLGGVRRCPLPAAPRPLLARAPGRLAALRFFP